MEEQVKNKIAWLLIIIGGLSAFISISIMEKEEFAVTTQALEMNVAQHGPLLFLKIWLITGIALLALGIIMGFKKL